MSKYCNDCKRNVTPRRRFSLAKFLLLFGVFYIFTYPFQSKVCPFCKGTLLSDRKEDLDSRLAQLKMAFDKRLITEDEYNQRKDRVLKESGI
jgi:hypothetical protein